MRTKDLHIRHVAATLLIGSLTCASMFPASADSGESGAGDLTGILELGVVTADDADYSFGRYSGIDDDKTVVNGGVDLQFRPGRPDYLRLRGSDLGLNTRRLMLEYGEQGRFDTFLEYRQLPHLILDTAKTPFAGVGSNNLVVAPGASPTSLRALTLETERERLEGGVSVHLDSDWSVSVALRREEKQGTDWVAGALQRIGGGSGAGSGISVGQSYSVILPEPVDQTTTEFDASLDYTGERSQLRLAFHSSIFDNRYASLNWQNPGFTPTGMSTLPTSGRLSLEPDNRFFQINLSGAHQLAETTRINGLMSFGVMQQDEPFLPFGVNTAGGLPRDSLDGEVYVYSLRAGLTSRPWRPLRLKAQYRYDERDNRTPRAAYLYDVMDSGKTPSPAVAVVNEPLSYRKHKASIEAGYRLNRALSTTLGYSYRNVERDNADVDKSAEHEGKARLRWRIQDDLETTLSLLASARDADEYVPEITNQNPLLRKYTLADRDRRKAGFDVAYTPWPELSLGVGTDFVWDDFSDSGLGITDARSMTHTLDIAYRPTPGVLITAFYAHDAIESQQRGSDPGVTPLYEIIFDDTVKTMGVGFQLDDLGDWTFGVNYRYSLGESDIRHRDLDAVGARSRFPTLQNELHAFEVNAGYRISKNTTVRLAAVYENLDAEDWAFDDVPPHPLNQLLTLGNESEDHDAYAFFVAVQHRF